MGNHNKGEPKKRHFILLCGRISTPHTPRAQHICSTDHHIVVLILCIWGEGTKRGEICGFVAKYGESWRVLCCARNLHHLPDFQLLFNSPAKFHTSFTSTWIVAWATIISYFWLWECENSKTQIPPRFESTLVLKESCVSAFRVYPDEISMSRRLSTNERMRTGSFSFKCVRSHVIQSHVK